MRDKLGPVLPTFDKFDIVNDAKGMTLRQYIAIKAMEGVLANSDAPSWITANDIKRIKEVAYAMADAMLKEDES